MNQLVAFATFLIIGYCVGCTHLYYACQGRMIEQQWNYLERSNER